MGFLDFFKPAAAGLAPEALLERQRAGEAPLVLDVRRPDEYAEGHLPGARNIPHDALEARLGELGAWRERDIVICCRSGVRAGMAAAVLRRAGFARLRLLDGHMGEWVRKGRPVEKGA